MKKITHFVSALLGLYLFAHASISAAEPEIELFYTNKYEYLWSPAGSGKPGLSNIVSGPSKGFGPKFYSTFYRAKYPDNQGYKELAWFGQHGGNAPTGMVVAKDLSGTALRKPTDFQYIWDDHDTGADRDASFWRPIPPAGYQCMGDLMQYGRSKPSVDDSIMCVREDLLMRGETGKGYFVWNSRDACRQGGLGGASCTDAFSVYNVGSMRGSGGISVRGAIISTSRNFRDDRDYQSQGNSAISSDDPFPSELDTGYPTMTGQAGPVWVLKPDAVKAPDEPSQNLINSLMSRFGPEIRMHPDETYLPDDPAKILDGNTTWLRWGLSENEANTKDAVEGPNNKWRFDTLGVVDTSSKTILTDIQDALEDPNANDDKFVAYLDYGPTHFAGNINDASTYVRAQPYNGAFIELQFWIFYPYNGVGRFRLTGGDKTGGSLLGGLTGIGNGSNLDLFENDAVLGKHYSDWENVRVRFTNKDVYDLGSYKPVDIVLSRHSSDETLHYDDSRFQINRDGVPIVHSALGTHAQYPNAGAHYYDRKFQIKYWAGTAALDLLDLASYEITGGRTIDATFPLSSIPFADLEDVDFTTGTARFQAYTVPSYGLAKSLHTSHPGKHELVSSAWPNHVTNPPDWFYFMDQIGGYIPVSYGEMKIKGEPVKPEYAIEVGKPGLMERHEWNVPKDENANLGFLSAVRKLDSVSGINSKHEEINVSPSFKQDRLEYSVSVDNDINEISIIGIPVDNEARVEIKQGGANLKDTLAWDSDVQKVDKEYIGRKSALLPISVGDNVFQIVVSTLKYDVKSRGTGGFLDSDDEEKGNIDRSIVKTIHYLDPTNTWADTNSDGSVDQLTVSGKGVWTVNEDTGKIEFAPESGYTGDTTATVMPVPEVIAAKTYTLTVSRTNYTVENTAYSGAGSLSYGLANAQNGDVIHINSSLDGQTIFLSSSFNIDKDITIDASQLPNGLKLSGQNSTRHFYIDGYSGGKLSLKNLTLLNGSTATSGGSILNTGTLELRNCRIVNNNAAKGGGISNVFNSLSDYALIIGSTIENNKALQSGGGIHNNSQSNGPQLIQSTVSGNQAPIGGAMHNESGVIKLFNSTVAQNTTTNSSSMGLVDEDGGFQLSYSTVNEGLQSVGSGGTGTSLKNSMLFEIDSDYTTIDNNIIGARSNNSNRTGAAPHYESPLLLSTLGNFGGNTKTMLPLPNSYANDNAVPNSLNDDQKGDSRSTSTPDIGAVEAPSLNLPFLNLSDGKISPTTIGNGRVYSVTIAYDVEDMSFATALPLPGVEVSSSVAGGSFGSLSEPVPLVVGTNVVRIKADFYGLFDDIYTINVTRSPPSNNANLRFLASSSMELNPVFDRGITNYNAGTIAGDELQLWAKSEHHAGKVEVRVNGGSYSTIADIAPISSGDIHGLRLGEDGSVIGYGSNSGGQANDLQADSTDGFKAVSGGSRHSVVIDSKANVRAWGENTHGQLNIPTSLHRVVSVSSYNHNLAITRDANVIAWGGDNAGGQLNVPDGLSEVVAVAAGAAHSLALKADGTVVMWGSQANGGVPAGLINVVAISAGASHSLALKSDGTVVRWGSEFNGGLSDVPSNLVGVVDISAATDASFALMGNGRVTEWGSGNSCEASAYTASLENVVDFSSGSSARTALHKDGSITSWSAYGSRTLLDAEKAILKTPVTATPAIPLDPGSNTIEVKLTAEDGTTVKTYTIVVIRDDTAIATQYELAPQAINDILLENKVYYENTTLIGQTIYYRVTGSDTPAVSGSPYSNVWGSGVYSLRSDLANAAVHAGVLSAGEEGVIAITIVAAPNVYESSTMNGVTSRGSSYSLNPDPATAISIAAFTGDPLADIKQKYDIRPGLTPKDLRCFTNEVGNTMRFLVRGSKPTDPSNPASGQYILYQAYADGKDANGNHVENATFVNRYSHDSSLATAAVHAGILQDGETGIIDVTYEGRFSFDKNDVAIDTTLKNGVKPSEAANGHRAAAIGGYTLKGVTELDSNGDPVLGSIATLASLTMSGNSATFTPAFAPNVFSYEIKQNDPFNRWVNVAPTLTDDQATIEFRLNGSAYVSTPNNTQSAGMGLDLGENTINVKVTAANGVINKTYSFDIYVLENNGIDVDLDNVPDATDNCYTVPNANQSNADGDSSGDACDADDDNDGVEDALGDTHPLNPLMCRDNDSDGCDDCSVGTDGFGPLADFNVSNDGLDSDGNGQCNVTDDDDDNDGMPDAWEIQYGFDPLDPYDASQDADGDRKTNLQEFLDGTSPVINNAIIIPIIIELLLN